MWCHLDVKVWVTHPMTSGKKKTSKKVCVSFQGSLLRDVK